MKNRKKDEIVIQNSDNPNFAGKLQLFDSEKSLIRYTTEIVDKFNNYLIKKNYVDGTILEFGAGTGFLAEIFRDQFKQFPICVELDPNLRKIIQDKKFICYETIQNYDGELKAIYTSNVLEHIEDDEIIIRDFYSALKNNGKIGIYVPAFQHLYSDMDREINHIRRYSKAGLIKKVESAGFTVEKVHYDDFIGYFASLAVKILGYKGKAKLGSKRSLDFYDKYVYTLSRRVDSIGGKYLIGKNIFLIAAKKT